MIWTVVLRTQQKWIHQHFYSSSTPHSEIGPGNLLSHHSVTTLPLLLPIVLMCAKLISTCLHASRNKRCNLQAPWTLIYLVLLLLLPPHGWATSCVSPLGWGISKRLGAGSHPCCHHAAGRCPWRGFTISPVCMTTPYTYPHWTGAAIYLLNRKSRTQTAFFVPGGVSSLKDTSIK